MNENSWFVTAQGDNAALSVSKAAEVGARHVITGFYAGFDGAAVKGTVELLGPGGAAVITLRFVGQISMNGLNIEFANSRSAVVGITLTASGAAGTFGSVLLNGYTK